MASSLGHLSESLPFPGKTSSSFGNIRIADVGWLLVFNALIFSPVLEDYFSLASYIDEASTLLLLVLALFKLSRERIGSFLFAYERRALLCFLLFVLITFASGAFSGVCPDPFPVFIDFFTCCKFFLCFLGSIIIFRDNSSLLPILNAEAKLLVFVLFVCAIPSVLTKTIFSSSDVRFGLYSFQFLYGHPTNVNFVMAACLCLLATDCKRNRFWIYLALIVMVLTLRSKGIGAAGVFLFCLLTVERKKRITLPYVAFGILIVVYLGWDSLVGYYTGEGYARPELTKAGFLVANDYFPLGSGFATFGSAVTANQEYYSPLYYVYGLSNVWGLSVDHLTMISDVFWPALFAQSGYFGGIFYAVGLLLLFLCGAKNRKALMPTICCFVYLLIASSSESAFFHPMAICIAFCAGISLSKTNPDRPSNIKAVR